MDHPGQHLSNMDMSHCAMVVPSTDSDHVSGRPNWSPVLNGYDRLC